MSGDDRTLPVTPAERTAATMLRAWQAWKPDPTDIQPMRHLLARLAGTTPIDAPPRKEP